MAVNWVASDEKRTDGGGGGRRPAATMEIFMCNGPDDDGLASHISVCNGHLRS